MFNCTNASNAKKVDKSLEKCVTYFAIKLIMGGSEVRFTLKRNKDSHSSNPLIPSRLRRKKSCVQGAQIQHEAKMKAYIQKMVDYRENCKFRFNVHQKLKTVTTWATIYANQDLIRLVQ